MWSEQGSGFRRGGKSNRRKDGVSKGLEREHYGGRWSGHTNGHKTRPV